MTTLLEADAPDERSGVERSTAGVCEAGEGSGLWSVGSIAGS